MGEKSERQVYRRVKELFGFLTETLFSNAGRKKKEEKKTVTAARRYESVNKKSVRRKNIYYEWETKTKKKNGKIKMIKKTRQVEDSDKQGQEGVEEQEE